MAVFGSAIFLGYRWDRIYPVVAWSQAGGQIGEGFPLAIDFSDKGNGLGHLSVVIQQGKKILTIRDEWVPKEDITSHYNVELDLAKLREDFDLEEGQFEVMVKVSDVPNWGVSSRTTSESYQFSLDTKPPLLSVLSSNHYIRQGGSQLISFATPGEKAEFSGVRVGETDFQAYRHPEDSNIYVALIGLPYNHSEGSPIVAWAVDSVGNRAQSEVEYRVIPVRYRKRVLTITDKFIRKVSSEILSRTSEVHAGESLKETFFNINNALREKNHDQIRLIGRSSAGKLLFAYPFVQLLNSKVEAGFADERDYAYGNEIVDKQTHMGFDLASRARSDVNVANDGRVVWADYLGIYGNCVIVDHGLGLMSLYGHLSSIAVEVDQPLKRGQSLGKTGATGLAGGDHLHFTTLIQGVQVNPMEWWDPKWVREQIFGRLQGSN